MSATLDPVDAIAAAGQELLESLRELVDRPADDVPGLLDEVGRLLRRGRAKITRAKKAAEPVPCGDGAAHEPHGACPGSAPAAAGEKALTLGEFQARYDKPPSKPPAKKQAFPSALVKPRTPSPVVVPADVVRRAARTQLRPAPRNNEGDRDVLVPGPRGRRHREQHPLNWHRHVTVGLRHLSGVVFVLAMGAVGLPLGLLLAYLVAAVFG